MNQALWNERLARWITPAVFAGLILACFLLFRHPPSLPHPAWKQLPATAHRA